eukprot:1161973-Pelagomonas_calceolata.AAC.11
MAPSPLPALVHSSLQGREANKVSYQAGAPHSSNPSSVWSLKTAAVVEKNLASIAAHPNTRVVVAGVPRAVSVLAGDMY